MNNFEFSNPVKVIFGEGVVGQLGKHAVKLGKKAVIVSYDDVSIFGTLFDIIRKSLKEAGVEYTEYFAVTANPTIEQAQGGIELCRSFNADLVIGVGGGSAMDCAKVIAAGVEYPHELKRMISFSHSKDWQIPPTTALPMILIPTLPATGSEMNPTAVITDEQSLSKSYVWAPDCLYAKVALIDPSLGKTLPPYQTACGALDTIAHTLESYFNGETDKNLDLQDRLQEGLVCAVMENIPKVLETPEDIQTRGVMQWASAIALNGWLLSGTYTWAPMHQLGHVVSTRFNATHGATLAVIMIAWLKFWKERNDNERYKEFAKHIFNTNLKEAIVRFEKLVSDSGVETRLSEFGIEEQDIDLMTDDVVRISFGPDSMLASRPPINREEVRTIYKIALR